MGGRSLASDAGLLNFLKDFSGQLREQTKLLENQVTELVQNADSAKIRLHNTFNHFLQLSQTQYMENRVYDEDVANISKESESTAGSSGSSSTSGAATDKKAMTHEELESLLMPKYTAAIQLGVTALMNAPTFVELDDFGLMAQAAASSSVADLSLSNPDGAATSAAKPVVRYDWETPLPHVIGTREFQEEEFCGLWLPPAEPEPEDQLIDDLSADHFTDDDYESDGPADADLIPDLPVGASPTTEALLAPPVLPSKKRNVEEDDDDDAESRSDDGEEEDDEEDDDNGEEEDEESEVSESEDDEQSGDDEWDDEPKQPKRKTRKGKKPVTAAAPKAPMSFQEQLAASLMGQMRGDGAPLPSAIKGSGKKKGKRGKRAENKNASDTNTAAAAAAGSGKAEDVDAAKATGADDEAEEGEENTSKAPIAPIKAKTGLSLFDNLDVADDEALDAMLLSGATAAKAPAAKTSTPAAAAKPKSAFSLDDLDLDDPDALFDIPVVGKKPPTTSAASKQPAGAKLSLLDALSLGEDDDDDGNALFAPSVAKPGSKTPASTTPTAKKGAATLDLGFNLDDDEESELFAAPVAKTPLEKAMALGQAILPIVPPASTTKKPEAAKPSLDFFEDGEDDFGFAPAKTTTPTPTTTTTTTQAKTPLERAKALGQAIIPPVAAAPAATKPAEKKPASLMDFSLDDDLDGDFLNTVSLPKKTATPTPSSEPTKPKPNALSFSLDGDDDDGELFSLLPSKPATATASAATAAKPAAAKTLSTDLFGLDDDDEFGLSVGGPKKPATPAARPASPAPTPVASKPAATTKSNNSLLSSFGDGEEEDELFSVPPLSKPTPQATIKSTATTTTTSPAPATQTNTTASLFGGEDLFDFPASPVAPKTRAASPPAAAVVPASVTKEAENLREQPQSLSQPPASVKKTPATTPGLADLFGEDDGMFDFPSPGAKPAAAPVPNKGVHFEQPEPPKQSSASVQEQPTRARAGSRIAELQGKLDLNVGALLPGSAAPSKPAAAAEHTTADVDTPPHSNDGPARPLQHLTKDRAQTAKKRPPTRGKRTAQNTRSQPARTTSALGSATFDLPDLGAPIKTSTTTTTTTTRASADPVADMFDLSAFKNPSTTPTTTTTTTKQPARGGAPAMASGADVLGALDGFDSFFDAPTGQTEEQLRVAEAAKYSHPTAQKERIKAAQIEQTRQAAMARLEQDKARAASAQQKAEEEQRAAAARAQQQQQAREEEERAAAQRRAEDERRTSATAKTTTTTGADQAGEFDLDDLLAPVVLQKKPRPALDVADIFAMPSTTPATDTKASDIFSAPATKPSRPALVFEDNDLFADPLSTKQKPTRSFDVDSFFS